MASIFYAYKVQIHRGHFLNPSFVSHKPRKFQTNIVSLNFRNRQMEPPLVYGNLCAKKIMSQTTLSVETSCTHTLGTFAFVCVCVCVCVSLSLSLAHCFLHAFVSRYVYEIQESSVIRSLYLLTNILRAGFFLAFIRGLILLFYGHILLGSCLQKGTVFQKWAPDLKLEGQGVSQSEGVEAALQIEGLPWNLPFKVKLWTNTYPLQKYAQNGSHSFHMYGSIYQLLKQTLISWIGMASLH
jgi:hypothetical protein